MQAPRESATPDEFERAIEVFARAWCFARSFTHPYLAERVNTEATGSRTGGSLWVLRDTERRSGRYRNEEWVSHGLEPERVHAAATGPPPYARGGYTVCAIHASDEPDQPLRTGFKALDYRLIGSEPFMVHRLRRIPRVAAPATIRRVRTPQLAARLAKAARSRQILPENLGDDAPQRQYVALIDGAIVGWVGSIAVEDATWCQNMFVQREFRRRGIARAMLCRLLRDDRGAGAKLAVLLASHTGAKLYTTVGYRQIGTLLLFSPRKRPAPNTR